MQTTFKDRLDILIKTLNVSQTSFAKLVGINKQNISNYLKGEKMPGAKVLEKILITNPSLNEQWLITGKGEMWKIVDFDELQSKESDKLNETEHNIVVSTLKNEIERLYGEIKIREKILKMIEEHK